MPARGAPLPRELTTDVRCGSKVSFGCPLAGLHQLPAKWKVGTAPQGHRWGPLAPEDSWKCWGSRGRGSMGHEAALQAHSAEVMHPAHTPLSTRPEASASLEKLPPGDRQGRQFTESSRVGEDGAPAQWAHLYLAEGNPTVRIPITQEDKLRLREGRDLPKVCQLGRYKVRIQTHFTPFCP